MIQRNRVQITIISLLLFVIILFAQIPMTTSETYSWTGTWKVNEYFNIFLKQYGNEVVSDPPIYTIQDQYEFRFELKGTVTINDDLAPIIIENKLTGKIVMYDNGRDWSSDFEFIMSEHGLSFEGDIPEQSIEDDYNYYFFGKAGHWQGVRITAPEPEKPSESPSEPELLVRIETERTEYRVGETTHLKIVTYYDSGTQSIPIPDAALRIQVTDNQGATDYINEKTDETGKYSWPWTWDVNHVGTWVLKVVANKEGYVEGVSNEMTVTVVFEPLAITVETDKKSYDLDETVIVSGYVTCRVGSSSKAPPKPVSVYIVVENMTGQTGLWQVYTDSEGYYEKLLHTPEKASEGTYEVKVTASETGYSDASAETSFVVCGIKTERERLERNYPGLKEGYLLYSEGRVSWWKSLLTAGLAEDPYGHVGIYIGDYEHVGYSYEVRDEAAAPLKVYRRKQGIFEPKYLQLGEQILEGDRIIGAVVEARQTGVVFTTVDGMKKHAQDYFGREKVNFDWKTTYNPPTPDQVMKIREFALKKVQLTEGGLLEFDLGEKGSTDWANGKEEWDCVSLAEAAYEYAGLDPTPDAYEGPIIGLDVYLRPQEQYDKIDRWAPPVEEVKTIGINVRSPVNLHLYDSQGNHVGPSTEGGLDTNILNVYYYQELEEYPQAILVLGAEEQYTLKIEALDEGSFDLHVMDLNLCNPGKMTEVEFQDVPIKKGTLANLKLGSAGSDFAISVDLDGDGKGDQEIEPTSIEIRDTASSTTKSQIEPRARARTETWTVTTPSILVTEGDTASTTTSSGGGGGGTALLFFIIIGVIAAFLYRRRKTSELRKKPTITKPVSASSFCITCGKEITAGSYCQTCGKQQEPGETIYCEECGAPLPAGSWYCSHCGDKQGAA